jgi:hypothetical protein
VTVRGFVVVPQFFAYAKTFDDLTARAERRGDASAYEAVCGPLGEPTIVSPQPSCPFGSVVFRVEDDYSLVQVASDFDSSG